MSISIRWCGEATWGIVSVEPVSPLGGSGIRVDERFEHTATSLDDCRRADIVFVTGHQYTVDTDGSGNDQAVAQDRGRITAPAMLRDNAVADVTAFSSEEFVELMADRCAANELTTR